MTPLSDTDHIRGPGLDADAAVSLVQYGDFECPYSKQVHQIVREVMGSHPGRVRFAFRHFPVRYHPHALIAAIAAEAVEAAHGADAFWAYHDRLYEHPSALRRDQLPVHAEALGYDRDAVHRALEDEARKTEILAQKRGGVKAGVRSTLNLWIDGELFEEDDLEEALIERVIKPLHA